MKRLRELDTDNGDLGWLSNYQYTSGLNNQQIGKIVADVLVKEPQEGKKYIFVENDYSSYDAS